MQDTTPIFPTSIAIELLPLCSFFSKLKLNSSWKWQPSWLLKLVYLSQLTCSKNSLLHWTLLIYHSCHSLGFLDTKLTWFASSFFFSTLSLLTASKAAIFPKIDIRYFTRFSLQAPPLPSSFLEREVLSTLTGWSLHLPPRGFRCPARRSPLTHVAVTYRDQWEPSSIRGTNEMKTASQRLWKLY